MSPVKSPVQDSQLTFEPELTADITGVTNGHKRRGGRLSHLDVLEAESIQILREVAAEFSRPAMLYSIGKDSSVMLRLAQKAFYPGKVPFPMPPVDTPFKFPPPPQFPHLTSPP